MMIYYTNEDLEQWKLVEDKLAENLSGIWKNVKKGICKSASSSSLSAHDRRELEKCKLLSASSTSLAAHDQRELEKSKLLSCVCEEDPDEKGVRKSGSLPCLRCQEQKGAGKSGSSSSVDVQDQKGVGKSGSSSCSCLPFREGIRKSGSLTCLQLPSHDTEGGSVRCSKCKGLREYVEVEKFSGRTKGDLIKRSRSTPVLSDGTYGAEY
ncbi:hypothetical protein R1flu_014138 [Riccia fluitans]|uniref:Uncharacterized protein n=1 Tax=Riccia fluitans TaxID=41844 RepID=A0ABD1YIZ5_9MARC